MQRRIRRSAAALTLAATCLPLTVSALGAGGVAAQSSATTSCSRRPHQSQAAPRLESYTPVNPKRLVDTRDGTGGARGPLGAGCTLALQLAAPDVPTQAAAVTISLTVVTADRGFFTAFPCAAGNPGTSNVNARGGGLATPGLVVSALDADRRICIYSSHGGDVIVDLNGWWSSSGSNRHSAVEPFRAYDTRELRGAARVRAGEVRGISLAGTAVPVGAAAASVNLTVVGAAAPGHIVIFPCGFQAPLASNLNFLATEARAVAAIVGLDAAGGLCVRPSTDVHVIIDVNGYYGGAPPFGVTSGLQPVTGVRVVDTRSGQGLERPLAAGDVRRIRPLEGTGITPGATSVLLNIVTTNTTVPGWVAAFPCGSQVPLVSSVNFWGPGEAMNLAAVKLSGNNEVCIRASAPTDVVIDVYGTIGPRPGVFAERLSFGSRRAFPELTGEGTDYGVYCDSGTTSVDVELDLIPGATARINGIMVQEGTTSVAVPANGLFTVDLRWTVTARRYHFRCLPPDFPQVFVERPGTTQPGWYLATFGLGDAAAATPFLVILDHHGAPVWYKRATTQVLDLKRLSNGTLAFTPLLGATFGIDPARGYVVTNLLGSLVAERTTSTPATLPVDHHDFVEVPGGGWALISYPLVKNQDLTALGAGFFADDSIVDGTIQELNAAGAEVWRWDASDYFAYGDATFAQRFALYPGEPHGGEVDVWHLNSIQRVPDGDYVVSARHLDAAFRVDRQTGGVLWTLGGKPSVPNRLTIVGDPLGGPRRPHHATLTGDVLTLFDNRAATGQPARAVAYRIDESAKTATLLWQINEPLGRPSFGLGSTQVTADGTRLVSWGGLQPMLEEYAPDGQLLLKVSQANPLTTYRVIKYRPTAFNAAQLRATAGGNVALPGT